MSLGRTEREDAEVWVKILHESEEYSFGRLFRIVRAKLQYHGASTAG